MNTTLSRSALRPPDTEDRQVLQIPARGELRELALSKRLSFRIGLWLLERATRPRRVRARRMSVDPLTLAERSRSPREAELLLTFDLQRQMR